MLNILKYLKKHVGLVLVIVALLVVQAYCDLTLPQYTSDIVDVGIQQGPASSASLRTGCVPILWRNWPCSSLTRRKTCSAPATRWMRTGSIFSTPGTRTC